jgi:hypothetical protein
MEQQQKNEILHRITVEQQNIWNHIAKIIPLLIGNNVHLNLQGGNIQQSIPILQLFSRQGLLLGILTLTCFHLLNSPY